VSINDAVDWAADLGGGTRVALIQAGSFRSDAGALFGPVPRILWNGLVTDEIDDEHRLLQALNCLLVETPAGRVLVETGIGERVTDKVRAMRRYEGPAIVPALQNAGFDPATVDVVAMSHLHFDHAGGLDSVEVKGSLFSRAADEGWIVALSHESKTPIGRLTPDGDRFRFEAR
jgi:glyoxylase-like metal-dependent hydrolase (beta-lactamase superfamily II)